MSLNTNSIPVFGPLGPLGPKDAYPTHFANFGLGGMMQVRSTEERDAIPQERRVEGLQVLVFDPLMLEVENPTVFVLSGGLTNNHWQVVRYSIYSSSYGPQVMFSASEPSQRKGGAQLCDGDLWVEHNTYFLYVYSEAERRWILLTGGGGGGSDGGGGGAPAPGSTVFPGVRPRYPENTLPISSDPWDNGATTLTASGCIQISLDNVTYGQGPLSIEDTDVLWTRWAPTEGCGLAAHDTTLTGRITNGVHFEDGSLTLARVPNNFNFSDLTDQLVSSVSSSNQITLVGLNAPTKIWAPSGTGTSRQVSINGGSWVSLPSSFGSALTIPFQVGGPTVRVRHTNSAELSTSAIMSLRVGDADLDLRRVTSSWSTTTVSSGPSIAQPSILTPANNSTNISIPTTLTSSTYSAINGAGAHVHSDWQVNSGALATTSTNLITSLSYINTDLGPNRWFLTSFDQNLAATIFNHNYTGVNTSSSAQAPRDAATYYEGHLSVTNHAFTVNQYAYSPKLNRYVAVGFSASVARIARRGSSGSWVNCSVDLEDNRRQAFSHVIWNQKNQKFVALRDFLVRGYNTVDHDDYSIVYNSADGIVWTEVGVLPFKLPGGHALYDYGDFIYAPGSYYHAVSTNGSSFTIIDTPHPISTFRFGTQFNPAKVRNKWFSAVRPTFRNTGWFSYELDIPGGVFTSDSLTQGWVKSGEINMVSSYDSNNNFIEFGMVRGARAHYDAAFFRHGNKLYYTTDGVDYAETAISRPAVSNVLAYDGTPNLICGKEFYYLVTKNNITWRAPRTMITIAIQGTNSDGFAVGQRVRVDGVPYTYGWIHSITSSVVTIRGAFGDWSNVIGRTISTDVGDSGLGLIVNLQNSEANKTSYAIPSELMGPNIDYFSRVRYGDGDIKSLWSPWSKFTTGA